MSIARRNRQPELMDDPALDPAEHRRALTDLARINAVSGSASVLWPPLRRLARQLRRPVRVLDVATGRGDVPIALHHRAVRRGLSFELTGCDLSPIALQATADAVRAAGVPMQLLPLDAVRDPIPGCRSMPSATPFPAGSMRSFARSSCTIWTTPTPWRCCGGCGKPARG
ncbi:MAG: hypothetical protein MUF18_15030 [Fimbriiglobus sp.]|nr:hypothetical protein [Fimbriiglobus sp.]